MLAFGILAGASEEALQMCFKTKQTRLRLSLCVSDGNGADEGSYKVLSCASADTRRLKNLLRVIL